MNRSHPPSAPADAPVATSPDPTSHDPANHDPTSRDDTSRDPTSRDGAATGTEAAGSDQDGPGASVAHLPVPADPNRLPGSPLSLDPFTPGALPLPRWFGILVSVSAIGLLPWIVYLAFELPVQSRSAHYDVAWVGFDIAMFAGLAVLAVAALKRSTWTEPLATFTATLLIVDAWFDVVTADNPMRRMEAVTSAVLIEVPLALVCAWIAHNTERLRRRAYRALWAHLNTVGQGVAAPPGPDVSATAVADALHQPQDRA